ncbi:MAG TPA: hypothetical protein VGS12_11100 [Caulobacteraceae bacterium]|nr:hypothetical protein [Caulobacteraceae bacterium]
MTDHFVDDGKLSALGTQIASGVRAELDDATKNKLAPAIAEYRRLTGRLTTRAAPSPAKPKRPWWPFSKSSG